MPLHIEIVVNPITELRLTFGRHNKIFVFDEQGFVEDPHALVHSPRVGQRSSTSQRTRETACDDWARVTMDTDREERRVFVDGILRHTWRDDFSDVRSRIAIGVRKSSVTLRSLDVRPLRTE